MSHRTSSPVLACIILLVYFSFIYYILTSVFSFSSPPWPPPPFPLPGISAKLPACIFSSWVFTTFWLHIIHRSPLGEYGRHCSSEETKTHLVREKTFNWGLAYSFRDLVHYHMTGSMGAGTWVVPEGFTSWSIGGETTWHGLLEPQTWIRHGGVFRKQRQVDLWEFEASLVYTISSRIAK